ncbi:N-acetyltransferase [Planktomarina sp.]|nr:N-acetyltransferase [Planktomarina sp.]
MYENVKIHETAIVDPGAEIGSGTRVWHWVHICGGSRIGRNVSLGQNVFVGNVAIIGDNCKIQNNVSIYDNITLEDGVFCGPSVVFTNVYNPRAGVDRKKEFKTTYIKRGASLGANCTIICGVEIGEYAFIGAGSVVKSKVPDFQIVAGVPAKPIGWMKKNGDRLPFSIEGHEEYICIDSNEKYLLEGNRVRVTK